VVFSSWNISFKSNETGYVGINTSSYFIKLKILWEISAMEQKFVKYP